MNETDKTNYGNFPLLYSVSLSALGTVTNKKSVCFVEIFYFNSKTLIQITSLNHSECVLFLFFSDLSFSLSFSLLLALALSILNLEFNESHFVKISIQKYLHISFIDLSANESIESIIE